eukprot:TRINITY_DN2265_c0_g1_i2.p1 TRINITY_DN2265_c0_g1~~TRINITY_DN2265_c0_g1_i2.p1  ORF type:complete len:470 (-),score=69.38 TRINITY_DN2265_c0_g1_i2:801-2210(-)
MTTTRAASKRAAGDDSKGCGGAQEEGPNKRPALANLSNANSVDVRQSSAAPPGLNSAVHTALSRTRAPSVTRPQGGASKKSPKSIPIVICDGGSPDSEDNNSPENVPNSERPTNGPRIEMDDVPGQGEDPLLAQTDAAAIASLERRTVKNLNISAEPSNRLEGVRFSEDVESRWPCALGYVDIDNNFVDPQMCSIYAAEIYNNLRIAELRRRPSSNFMETVQREINSQMRGILIDWLVEVAEEYRLVPDTLYLTCAYIDRYLSSNPVLRSRLQLLGVSCMLIAAKYEEIYAPQVEEFCYITDNTYQRSQVIEMERLVLNNLNFELSLPTTKSFLRRFIRAAQASYPQPSLPLEFLGNYLAELTLVEYSFLQYLPSLIAASAVFLSKLTLNPEAKPWTKTLQHYTGYSPPQLEQCVSELHGLQLNRSNSQLPAIREKYRQTKFKGVSMLVPPLELDPFLFEELGPNDPVS